MFQQQMQPGGGGGFPPGMGMGSGMPGSVPGAPPVCGMPPLGMSGPMSMPPSMLMPGMGGGPSRMPMQMPPPSQPQLQGLQPMQASCQCMQFNCPRPNSQPQWQAGQLQPTMMQSQPAMAGMNYNFTGPPQPPQGLYPGCQPNMCSNGGYYMQQQPQQNYNMQPQQQGLYPAGSQPPMYISNTKKMSRKQ